jgi:molybdopterin-containing oxidoreductase family membrane subunit
LLAIIALFLLVNPKIRRNESMLAIAAALTFVSLWIEKGLGLVLAGFIPNPLEHITEYSPTAPELVITFAIYAIGSLILTVLYKVAIAVKEESA